MVTLIISTVSGASKRIRMRSIERAIACVDQIKTTTPSVFEKHSYEIAVGNDKPASIETLARELCKEKGFSPEDIDQTTKLSYELLAQNDVRNLFFPYLSA